MLDLVRIGNTWLNRGLPRRHEYRRAADGSVYLELFFGSVSRKRVTGDIMAYVRAPRLPDPPADADGLEPAERPASAGARTIALTGGAAECRAAIGMGEREEGGR
jgi:hypothetical protein